MKKRNFCIAAVAVSAILLIVYELVGIEKFGVRLDEPAKSLLDMTLTRGLGGAVFLLLVWYLGYKVLNPVRAPFGKSLLFCIPAFAVVINNLHIYSLAVGSERVSSDVGMIALLALECFCVALFEEMAFRGVVFLGILERKRERTLDIVIAILLSSAIFGLIHTVNLFSSSPFAVIQQIGYSFLIGAMCSVVLVKTANIWLCVALHGIFNFGGALVPTLGEGFLWDAPTVIITVIIALATTVYMTVSLIRMPMNGLDVIFPDGKKNPDN